MGYSLNLAGTAIYLMVATLYLADVTGHAPTPGQVALYSAVMLLTSKTAAGIAGSGFVALLLTLSLLPDIPSGAAAILLVVDRPLAIVRASTSVAANVLATLIVAAWDRTAAASGGAAGVDE